MGNKEIAISFVNAINARDPDALGDLMTGDHIFIDAQGNKVAGRETMMAGWRGYFEWFPDYQIEITRIFENGQELGLFGYAGGSFKGDAERSWRLPAAWRVVVQDGRVAVWQVYADTKIPFATMEDALDDS